MPIPLRYARFQLKRTLTRQMFDQSEAYLAIIPAENKQFWRVAVSCEHRFHSSNIKDVTEPERLGSNLRDGILLGRPSR
jgi:hypothetical protein